MSRAPAICISRTLVLYVFPTKAPRLELQNEILRQPLRNRKHAGAGGVGATSATLPTGRHSVPRSCGATHSHAEKPWAFIRKNRNAMYP